jgi:hypothetical protein
LNWEIREEREEERKKKEGKKSKNQRERKKPNKRKTTLKTMHCQHDTIFATIATPPCLELTLMHVLSPFFFFFFFLISYMFYSELLFKT